MNLLQNQLGVPSLETFEEYRLANSPLRYGQAFCNYYKLNDPSLFYETDDSKARVKATKYVVYYQLPLAYNTEVT
jgi:hypothetical protein